MTKDEIINCTDGQALADAVAVEVMGWVKFTRGGETGGYDDFPWTYYKVSETKSIGKYEWQPHKPTEKGKAQCWDLMVKCKVAVAYDYRIKAFLVSNGCGFSILVDKENLQITVLKAALLTVKE